MDVSNLLRQPTTSVVEGVAAPPKYRCGGAFLPQSNRSSAALLAGSLAALCVLCIGQILLQAPCSLRAGEAWYYCLSEGWCPVQRTRIDH